MKNSGLSAVVRVTEVKLIHGRQSTSSFSGATITLEGHIVRLNGFNIDSEIQRANTRIQVIVDCGEPTSAFISGASEKGYIGHTTLYTAPELFKADKPKTQFDHRALDVTAQLSLPPNAITELLGLQAHQLALAISDEVPDAPTEEDKQDHLLSWVRSVEFSTLPKIETFRPHRFNNWHGWLLIIVGLLVVILLTKH